MKNDPTFPKGWLRESLHLDIQPVTNELENLPPDFDERCQKAARFAVEEAFALLQMQRSCMATPPSIVKEPTIADVVEWALKQANTSIESIRNWLNRLGVGDLARPRVEEGAALGALLRTLQLPERDTDARTHFTFLAGLGHPVQEMVAQTCYHGGGGLVPAEDVAGKVKEWARARCVNGEFQQLEQFRRSVRAGWQRAQ